MKVALEANPNLVKGDKMSSVENPPSLSNASDVDDAPAVDLESVINNFLLANPTPTDEQVHRLAALVGLDYKGFEETVYQMVARIAEQKNEEVENDEVDSDDEILEPLDNFILTYFLFNSSPTDEQIHTLAALINLPHEELEERIYALLAQFNEDGKQESGSAEELDESLDLAAGELENDELDADDELSSGSMDPLNYSLTPETPL